MDSRIKRQRPRPPWETLKKRKIAVNAEKDKSEPHGEQVNQGQVDQRQMLGEKPPVPVDSIDEESSKSPNRQDVLNPGSSLTDKTLKGHDGSVFDVGPLGGEASAMSQNKPLQSSMRLIEVINRRLESMP